MQRRVATKWRPPLTLVLGGTLAAFFCLPLVGVVYLRVFAGGFGRYETSWMIGWITLTATAVIGFLLWRLVLRPVRALTAFARAKGDAPAPAHFGTPEFSQLGQEVLAMTASLRGREAVMRSYADHVTHELKSPLSAIRGAAELLADESLDRDDRAKLVGNISAATARMEELLAGQQALVRAHDPMPDGSCDLSELASDWPQAVVRNGGQVPLARDLMQIVLTHLINNAVAHGAGQVTLDLHPDRLIIDDDGPGISEGNRARIFEPFFTTNRDRGGTGMGLPIVQRMLAAHGSEINLTGTSGARFEILF